MPDNTTRSRIKSWLPAIVVVAVAAIVAVIFHQQIIAWFGGGDAGGAAAVSQFYSAGEYRLAVATDPPKPRVGENRIEIVLRDDKGEPVLGANVKAVAVMPAMGAMPEMRESAAIEERGGGRYSGTIDLSMAGEWPLTVTVDAPDRGEARVTFDMSTTRPGLRLTGGATDAGADGQPLNLPDLTPEGVAYYTCPMHPSVKSHDPSTCPICKMDLEPVTHEDLRSGTILVDAQRRQLIGLRTETVQKRELTREVRALGIVKYDERGLTDVSLKYRGWIGELYADYVGKRVEQGQPLLTIYSPELLTAQQEYLDAVTGGRNPRLLEASRTRLGLWGVTDEQLKELEARGRPEAYLPVLSPATGTVIDKTAVRGSAVEAGTTIMRIADLSVVWVEAELHESDLPLIEPGHEVRIELSYLPGRSFTGKVAYIYPYLDEQTRRGRVRIEADNSEGLLKPGMFAEVHLAIPLGERLAIPRDAVLHGGESKVVFLDIGDDRLRPQRITTGLRAGDYIEVLDGLEEGDELVVSGNFLIASETKLKTGVEKW